jgi:RNA polymerase sigma-70 factor (ECF subfamily)
MTEPVDWAIVYSEFYPKIYKYISRRATDYALVEDLTSEVFVRAIEADKQGKGPQKHLSGWLYRIAHNVIIDLYRANTCRPETIKLDAPADWDSRDPRTNGDILLDKGPMPHELAEQTILCEAVRICVASLNIKQRTVIDAVMQGFEYKEIAAMTNHSMSATKALWVRGLQQMRSMIDREGDPQEHSFILFAEDILRNLLEQHGSLSASDLAKYTNIPYCTVYTTLYRGKVFCQMDYQNNKRMWGLADLQKEAA